MLNEESGALPEEKPRPQFRLKLDHDDVYFGCEQLADGEEPKPDDVVLDHAPDNAPGQYRWLRAYGWFIPLPSTQQKIAQGAPTLEQAFYELARAVHRPDDQGLPRVKAWCEWFEKSIDGGKGS
jgi:hypothetical protein